MFEAWQRSSCGGMTLELLLHVIVVKQQHPPMNRSIANADGHAKFVAARC
jgi:hypothetical protein